MRRDGESSYEAILMMTKILSSQTTIGKVVKVRLVEISARTLKMLLSLLPDQLPAIDAILMKAERFSKIKFLKNSLDTFDSEFELEKDV